MEKRMKNGERKENNKMKREKKNKIKRKWENWMKKVKIKNNFFKKKVFLKKIEQKVAWITKVLCTLI